MSIAIRRQVPILACAAALFASFGEAAHAQGGAAAEAGQAKFNNACRTCHSVKEGDNRLGPNLHKILGRQAGSTAGYSYSAALKSSGLVWDESTLDKFITNTEQVAPGNNMKPYTGIESAEDRKAIISYLAAH